MKFTKTNDIYKIVRITGGYDNILGAHGPVKLL